MPYLGEVRMTSFTPVPEWWVRCRGQLLPIEQNRPLFALLGTAFGGDGETTFALPDIPDVPCSPSSARHVDEKSAEEPRMQALHYVMCIQGDIPIAVARSEAAAVGRRQAEPGTIVAHVGEIRAFPYGFAPAGWALCDGQSVEKAGNEALLSQLPDQAGGDGETFALPKLDPLPARVGSLDHYIALEGLLRRVGGSEPAGAQFADVDHPMPDALVGELRIFAFAPPSPPGWLQCRGQSLPIADHQALFELIGKGYGSWGIPTFALPKVDGPPCDGWRLNMFISLGSVANSSLDGEAAADLAFGALDDIEGANARLEYIESGIAREQAGRAISAVLRLFAARPGTRASLEASAALSKALEELPRRE